MLFKESFKYIIISNVGGDGKEMILEVYGKIFSVIFVRRDFNLVIYRKRII